MKDTTSEEITVRLAIARSITSNLVDTWRDNDTSISLKKNVLPCLEPGSWTLVKNEECTPLSGAGELDTG